MRYKEAKRLRPQDQSVKDRLKAAVTRYKNVIPQEKIPLSRFVSRFNLSLRYWDEGKTDLALKEATYSISLLKSSNLPLGCAEHNLNAMKELTAKYKAKEREVVQNGSKSIKNMYRISLLLFDKRMLHKAEEYLRKTIDGIKESLLLAIQRKDDDAAQRLRQDFIGVEDDLAFCRKLRLQVGQADGPLLPCLTQRFDAPNAACGLWAQNLAERSNLDWRC